MCFADARRDKGERAADKAEKAGLDRKTAYDAAYFKAMGRSVPAEGGKAGVSTPYSDTRTLVLNALPKQRATTAFIARARG